MFKKSKIYSIGVEIDKQTIKIAQLKREFGAIALVQVVKKDLGTAREISNEEIADLIFNAIQDNKLKFDFLGLTFSGQMGFVRLVDLPPLSTDKIRSMIKYETQQQIPFSLESVFWDYCIIEHAQDLNKRRVALVALKKNLIEGLINKLKIKKMSPDLVEITPFSIFNLAHFNNELTSSGLIGLIYLGIESTDFILYREGNIWLRSFPLGADKFISSSKEKLGLDSMERIATFALEKSSEVSQVLESPIDAWVLELKHTLDYYYAQDKKLPLGRLVLSGEWVNAPGLEAALEKQLLVKPMIMDPFKELGAQGKLHLMDKLPFATACGVALRGIRELPLEINLIKEKTKEEKIIKEKGLLVKGTYLFLIAAMLVSFLIYMKHYISNRAIYQDVTKELSQARIYGPKIKLLFEEKANLTQRMKLFYTFAKQKSLWIDVLNEITKIMPDDMWLTDFSAQMPLDPEKKEDVKLSITGKSFSYEEINSFVSSLKEMHFLNNVKTLASSYSEKDPASGRDILGFTVSMNVDAQAMERSVKVELAPQE